VTNTSRALTEALDLLSRFDLFVDQGGLKMLRAQRKPRSTPFDEEGPAAKDLRRIAHLVAVVHRCADELVDIAESYQDEQGRLAG